MSKKRTAKEREAKEQKKKLEEEQTAKQAKKKRETVITIVVVLAVLVIAFVGLWKLSGEDDKSSKQLAFTVGTEEVYMDEVNFCILQNTVDLGVDAEHLDSVTAEDGTSANDYYKQEILEMIMDYKVEYLIAKEQGITLTEEEEKEILLDVVEYMSKVNASTLNKWGVKQELVEEVYKQRYLAHKLEETVKNDVSAEDLTYCTVYLMLFPKVEMDEEGNYVTEEDGQTPILLSDEAIAQRKKDAEGALAELEEGADVVEVAEKYGVALYSGQESNTPDSFGEPFSDYAKKLKDGECSPLIDIASCYAIIQMIEDNNEELANQIREYYQVDLESDAVKEQREKWYEELGIGKEPVFEGKVWEKISLYDYVQ